MQLTIYTDLALRTVMYLASEKRSATIREISDEYNLSHNHLMKVVPKLVELGYVKTHKGRSGGVTLVVPARDIVVGGLVRAIEFSQDIIDCEGSYCPLTPSCLLKGVLNEAAAAFTTTLGEFTISDLVRDRKQTLRLIDTSHIGDDSLDEL